MPYRFLEDIAIADVAFEATGKTGEEMFEAAAGALLNVMVAEPDTVRSVEEVDIRLQSDSLEMLLFDLLNELIFFKDSKRLLLRVAVASIRRSGDEFTLTAMASGEQLDPGRHPLVVDVKAVTLHRFKVEKTSEGWRSVVVLDI